MQRLKTLTIWLVLLIAVLLVWQYFADTKPAPLSLTFSEFLAAVERKEVKEITIAGESDITGTFRENEKAFATIAPRYDGLVDLLRKHKVAITVKEENTGVYWGLLYTWLPIIVLVGLFVFLLRQMQAGSMKALSFGKSRARLASSDRERVTFADVAGCEEAKDDLSEIVQYLKDPQKFQRLGGKIPKGVLLVGPPGTGKTLLAKAVAGEANVPFFSISGSDFVEMFVGVGASRVRDLFEKSKKNAPCLIFIDELDAVGRLRGAGLGGGHDEREQTLNQLLVEMDGFETNLGVILLSATNRPDVLDPALLRPGRFDRKVIVDIPDLRGRTEILKVHTRKVPLAPDVNLETIARGTPGFTGADLANLANEAALLAARRNKEKVFMTEFEDSKDKVLMGSERRSRVISDEEKRTTAYHESGHTLVAMSVKHADPVHKVTIIPRGMALGVTQQLPVDDRHTYSKEYLVDRLAVLMGGRAAEELFLDHLTTGARDDLEKATSIARAMVCEMGMSGLGPATFGRKDDNVFLGREITRMVDYSEETARRIDAEVQKFLGESYDRAKDVLNENRETMERMVKHLLERETLTAEEAAAVVRGEELPPLEVAEPAPEPAPQEAEKQKAPAPVLTPAPAQK
ncbi:MAG: ATP-dependent zinc metalloprotease FtsH [Acidobacteriota bacterium]|nr:MAG: ATP-dependent zinc metalloprotease FtsH [Acidobacteriota bacterium]